MITNVIITNRFDAPSIAASLRQDGKNVCWITISNKRAHPLVNGSSKHVLVCKFDDINLNPITHNQARRIKNFVMNHHVNMVDNFVLVVNCHAGISRSSAVGMFCKHNLNIDVQFGKETFPNAGVMQAIGVAPKYWSITLQQAIWDDKHAIWRT